MSINNQCQGCQAGWPFTESLLPAIKMHAVLGGYKNEKAVCTATEYAPRIRCSDCGDPCKAVEETFDYSGTHCTNGVPGTHHTGIYKSNCCDADLVEDF